MRVFQIDTNPVTDGLAFHTGNIALTFGTDFTGIATVTTGTAI